MKSAYFILFTLALGLYTTETFCPHSSGYQASHQLDDAPWREGEGHGYGYEWGHEPYGPEFGIGIGFGGGYYPEEPDYPGNENYDNGCCEE